MAMTARITLVPFYSASVFMVLLRLRRANLEPAAFYPLDPRDNIFKNSSLFVVYASVVHGRAPAGDLCLKTNLPWVAFEGVSALTPPGKDEGVSTEEVSSTGGATGGAVGASGTTLLPPVGVVQPGMEACMVGVRG